MTDNINKVNINGLEDWHAGRSPLTAKHLQQPVDVLKGIGGHVPPGQVAKAAGFFEVRQFQVVRLELDVIICNFFDGKTAGTDEIKVAMPFLLRKSPFDKATRTLPPRAGITYEYSDFNKRKATNTDGDEEDQILVDSYEALDIIFASRGIFGNTAVFHDPPKAPNAPKPPNAPNAPPNSQPVFWLDNNIDGRFWAQDDDAEEEAEE